MSVPPGSGSRYEVVVSEGRGSVLAARVRAVAHTGRVRLRRLRSWLGTPQGRRTVLLTGRALAAVAAVAGAIVLVRRWTASARGALAAIAAGYRSAAGAVGAATDGLRFILSLGWLSRLLRWSAAAPATHTHRHCPDCHARIRADARVCYRCRWRPTATDVGRERRALWAAGVWTWRVLLLRLYHRCPDCRRLVHADARVCRSCGYRPG